MLPGEGKNRRRMCAGDPSLLTHPPPIRLLPDTGYGNEPGEPEPGSKRVEKIESSEKSNKI